MSIDSEVKALQELERAWRVYNVQSREHAERLLDSARKSLALVQARIADLRRQLNSLKDDEDPSWILAQIDKSRRAHERLFAVLRDGRARFSEIESARSTSGGVGLGELKRMIEAVSGYFNAAEISSIGNAIGDLQSNREVNSADRVLGNLPRGFVWLSLDEVPPSSYALTSSDRAAHFSEKSMERLLAEFLPRVSDFVTDRGFVDYDELSIVDRNEQNTIAEGLEAAARSFFGGEPIVVDARGGNQVINGRHRLHLAARLGLRYVPARLL